jgi:hypothetical protein
MDKPLSSTSFDPLPTPIPGSGEAKKYEDMTTEERFEYDQLQRRREIEEQAGMHLVIQALTAAYHLSDACIPPLSNRGSYVNSSRSVAL